MNPSTTHLKALKRALSKLEGEDLDENMEGMLCDFHDFLESGNGETFKVDDVYTLKLVNSEREYDGDGATIQAVFQSGDYLYAYEGFYSSYEGTEWDEISEIYPVVAKKKTIIVYERP